MAEIDARALRSAFGKFMTGVTVVTALDAAGEPLGFTANSFSSVSLDPPLLLVNLANSSTNFDAFKNASGFAVNILSEEQTAISNTFASPVEDRFDSCHWALGPVGSPVLEDVCAWFDCSLFQTVQAGDHLILIGQVGAFEAFERGGLGYANGGYFKREMEAEAAVALASDAQTHIAAVVRAEDSVLLVGSDEAGWQLPVMKGSGAESQQEFAVALGLELREFHVYSLYDDRPTQSHHVVYRCETSSADATQGRFFSLAELSEKRYCREAEAVLLQRYVAESSLNTFKVYIGDQAQGEVSRG